ncbi:uncharacterized protein LOC133452231 [Cololabis saira]|uniref:uncharacterized protein LOC133452231 n=1 Tax=Cololabis saira TaxID=129043 RepID=UPI002AD48AC8|nr:uncharacterized protein LOC133452231 [Cololabis saira]
MTMSSERHGNGSYAFTLSSNAGNQKLIQEIAVAKTSETVRVRGDFRHTVDHLKKLGVPANGHILVEVASAEGRTLAVQSWCGHQEAGLTLDVKSFPLSREIRGLVWHSWPWLRDAGLPFNTEGRCSVQGASSRLQFNTQLTVAGHQLLTSGVNVSAADGHLAALLSYCPAGFNQTGTRHELDAVLTAQFKGPLRGVSLDVSSLGRRVRVVGDVGGWGTHGGTKEAKVTLKHTVQGRRIPVVQVEAWGRLTDSQLRCSMAVNPELSSSLALIVQGRRVPHSKDLMVKVAHNTPRLLLYVPSQLNIRSQLNQSESSVAGLLELVSGRRRLWALGELAAIEGGFTQTVEVKHSCPQLKSLPRAVAVRTAYETRKWSYHVQQAAVWGNHEFSLSALYSAPPALDLGNQTLRVQLRAVPRRTCLEVMLERSSHARLHSVSLGWTRHGRLEQAKVVSEWSVSEERNETKLDLQQPFSSSLSKLSLQTVSHSSQRDQRSSHQAHLSWESAVPANVSVSLHQQWQSNSSRGQLCALLSALQPAASSVKGCVSVAQEGDSYSQNAELRWGNSTVKQGVKYQKNLRGMHSLQLLAGLDRVSPEPCPSHTLLAKVQTNLRDRLEHTVLLSICPAQPALSWSGSHRLKSGEELLYTESRLSVTGRPHECSFTLAVTNSSTPQGLNMSLFSETRVGNWSVEMGGAALSWSGGSSLRVQAGLDHQEKIWLNGTLGGRCLQTTAGFTDGLREQLSAAVCVGVDHTLTMNVQRRDGSNGSSSLGRLSLGASGRRFTLRVSGCLESLTAAEERIHYLSSRIQNKLVERIRRLQQFIAEFRKQSRDSRLLQELSAVPLHVSEQVEALLERGARGPLGLWHRSPLRHALTSSLPRFLGLLQHAALLGQQELRRPLATLAGVYQDVTGQRLEEVWRETVLAWTDTLVDVLAALLEKNPHLKTLSQAAAAALTTALDLAGQQTYSWTETRLASALSGVRKQLASLYKFSSRECAVSVSVPLPHVSSLRAAEAELTEILLEEWLLRPLQALAAVRPSAEFYRLKRKMMDSPFIHQALLVAGRFVVTFDGRLYELPSPCPLLLAQDVGSKRSFTLVLNSDSDTFLLVHLNNHTISMQHTGGVKVDCSNAVSHTFSSDDGLTVSRGSNMVQVSSQHGPSLSCDPSFELCSFTLDGWSHGASTGLLGTNDNDAFNDFPLHDGSQAAALEDFFHSWQLRPKCIAPPDTADPTSTAAPSLVSCSALFSFPDSPLGACFRVVDPGQFLSVCQLSSSRAPCRLAAAFVHLCKQNYIPLEVPVQCMTA